MVKKIPAILTNKYIIATLAFAVWVGFFDTNDLVNQFRLRSRLKEMQVEKTYLEQEISQTRNDQEELLSSPAKLEKFAREKYLMKKDNEDLYIIVDKEDGRGNPGEN